MCYWIYQNYVRWCWPLNLSFWPFIITTIIDVILCSWIALSLFCCHWFNNKQFRSQIVLWYCNVVANVTNRWQSLLKIESKWVKREKYTHRLVVNRSVSDENDYIRYICLSVSDMYISILVDWFQVQERVSRVSKALAEKYPDTCSGQTAVPIKTLTKGRKLYLFPGYNPWRNEGTTNLNRKGEHKASKSRSFNLCWNMPWLAVMQFKW